MCSQDCVNNFATIAYTQLEYTSEWMFTNTITNFHQCHHNHNTHTLMSTMHRNIKTICTPTYLHATLDHSLKHHINYCIYKHKFIYRQPPFKICDLDLIMPCMCQDNTTSYACHTKLSLQHWTITSFLPQCQQRWHVHVVYVIYKQTSSSIPLYNTQS